MTLWGRNLERAKSPVRQRANVSWQDEILVFRGQHTKLLVWPLYIKFWIVNKNLPSNSLVSQRLEMWSVTSVLDPAGVSFFHPRSDDVSLNPFCEPGEESLTNRQVWLDNLLVTASIW